MKPSILLLALAVITITSCTSAYKTGQTPDDVYFSPQRQQSEYVATNDRDEDAGYYNGDDYYGDRYLRMKVQNRYQWSGLDDYYYNDRYSYGLGGGYSYYNGLYANNPWSPVSYWNYYYNPYCTSYYSPYYSPMFIIGNKGNNYTVSNRPRVFNLNTYNNAQLTNGNYTNRRFDINNAPANNVNTNRYNNNYRNSRTNAGGFLRNAFGGNNNNNSYNNNNSSSSNNNNSNSSSSSGGRSSGGGGSSSSSGGGGSAPVRKF